MTAKAGENTEEGECFFTVGERLNYCDHYGNFVDTFQNIKTRSTK